MLSYFVVELLCSRVTLLHRVTFGVVLRFYTELPL